MQHIAFLSHQSRDKALVKHAALCLLKYEVKSIMDVWSFRKGRSLHSEITDGIKDSSAFVLFWSKNAYSSNYVQFEDELALARSLKDPEYCLHIVRLDDTPVPERHKFLLYHDWIRGKPGSRLFLENVRKLARAIQGYPDEIPPERMDEFLTVNEIERVRRRISSIGMELLGHYMHADIGPKYPETIPRLYAEKTSLDKQLEEDSLKKQLRELEKRLQQIRNSQLPTKAT